MAVTKRSIAGSESKPLRDYVSVSVETTVFAASDNVLLYHAVNFPWAPVTL
jgi:hypothetical protein